MRATIRDSHTLRRITPEALTDYLQAHGWVLLRRVRGASLWGPEGGLTIREQILVPADPGFSDYPQRVAEVLSVLESVEGRSQIEILVEIDPSLNPFGSATGLTRYFSTRLTFFDRFLVEGVIFGVLGRDTTCRVVEFKEIDEDDVVVRIDGAPQEDLEEVAEALWNRVWEQEQASQLRSLVVATKGMSWT